MLPHVPTKYLRSLQSLELEEQILNGAALIAAVSVFLPWISGEWLGGEPLTYTGFGFYTSFLGIAVFLGNVFLLLLTLIPAFGGPVLLKRRQREIVRLSISSVATILVLSSLSVLTKVTFEFSRMDVRYGIYFCLVANMVVLFEAFLRFVEQKRSAEKEVFHHPEDPDARMTDQKERITSVPPPPPPPPPLPPEDHPLYP